MNLKDLVPRICGPDPSNSDIRAFVSLCHRIAFLHLRKKELCGALHPHFLGLTTDDLAMDCVAPLFQRTNLREFVQLKHYFSTTDLSSLSEEDLLGHTRRLVFSKVNQELARLYQQTDPSLERILRNLRTAVSRSSRVLEERWGGESWVCLKDAPVHLRELPEIPATYLESHLSAELAGKTSLPHIVDVLADVFDELDAYRPRYPLVALALSIRTVTVRMNIDDSDQQLFAFDALTPDEIRKIIDAGVGRVHGRMRGTYVGKQKMNVRTYEAIFEAASHILQLQFLQDDGQDKTFFDHLKKSLPELTARTYQERHRCPLEYIVLQARQEVLETVTKEIQ